MRLAIVATPLGNKEDITLRAIQTLKNADLILCEDTRRTRKLLAMHDIHTPVAPFHHHSNAKAILRISVLLGEGKNLALVSDAGTPGIADPGNILIKELVERFHDQLEITPIPGPSAVTALASVAGISMDRFLFLGFPPHKKSRSRFFKEAAIAPYPVILYESPHRILRTLADLSTHAQERKVIVGKELTKMFEKIYRGTLSDVRAAIERDTPRGEYTIILS